MPKQDIGLALLSSASTFGAWSAWNSSLFTIDTFATDVPKRKSAMTAMKIGLATAVAIGVGTYLVYREKAKYASIAAILTGIVLYGAYYYKLKQNGKPQEPKQISGISHGVKVL